MKFHIYSILCLLLFSISSCEEDALPVLQSTNLVSSIKVIDYNNDGNAADLILLFSVDNPTEADQVQIFLSKSPDLSTIDRAFVDNIPATSLMSVDLSGTEYDISLSANLTDIDGNAIETDTEYLLGFLVVANGEKLLNQEFAQTSLINQHFLNGDYQGTWRDQLYSEFVVSAKIRLSLSGGRAGGEFFYRANFESCCEGTNDGSISFTLKDDGSLENFRYLQEVVNFNGGPCDGTYTGEGSIKDYTTLVFDFTGEDCEGPHGEGQLILKKE
ncbi:MAG: hypothetical protein R8P61_12040 [Bacteroidia bacterium]|nr:hypothetical protein [Bacteroidia bacterium]